MEEGGGLFAVEVNGHGFSPFKSLPLKERDFFKKRILKFFYLWRGFFLLTYITRDLLSGKKILISLSHL